MKKKIALLLAVVSILLVFAIPVNASSSNSDQNQAVLQLMTHGAGG